MSLIKEFEVRDDCLIVRLIGDLDHHETDRLREEWMHYLTAYPINHVILSLAGVEFIDSSGLGVILGRYKVLKSYGGSLIICSISRQVKRLFDLSGLFKIITFTEDEYDAREWLGVS